MPRLDSWLNNDPLRPPTAAQRAVDAWRRIQDRPTSITLIRLGTAQTFRVEFFSGSTRQEGEAATADVRYCTLFGVSDHPNVSVLDSNIQTGDQFALDGDRYQVLDVVAYPGEVQARCMRQS